VHKLSSSARYNLFPTIEMITALNRDFGVPLSEKEIKCKYLFIQLNLICSVCMCISILSR
jgi:hypothetical protein